MSSKQSDIKPVYRKRKRFNPHFEIYGLCFALIMFIGGFYFDYMNNIMNEVLVETAIVEDTADANLYKPYEDRLSEFINQQKINQMLEFHNSSSNEVTSSSEDIISSVETEPYSVPAGHSFKSYTYYTSLSQHSPQGQLQKQAYTDENGLRKVDDCYCAALGTYYNGNIGDKFLVTLSTGTQFKMILCDVKSDRHTDPTHRYTRSNGCVIEFYVDHNKLNPKAKSSGNISSISGFEGDITRIDKIIE